MNVIDYIESIAGTGDVGRGLRSKVVAAAARSIACCTLEKENEKTIDCLMYTLSMRLRIQVAMKIFDNQTSRKAMSKK
jgi:hypothetical protein